MLITQNLIDDLSKAALSNERLRKNICLHKSQESPAQVMINDLEVGTIVDIHRHSNTDETLIVLKGKMQIIYFNEKGEVQEKFVIARDSINFGVVIPKDQYHSICVTESVTVLEVKDGPYRPVEKDEIL